MRANRSVFNSNYLQRALWSVCVALVLLAVAPELRADEIFVQIGDIRGESNAKGYESAIQASSWSWGMSQAGTMHVAAGGGAGKADMQDLVFTHFVDMSSPALMQLCASGRSIDKARVSIRQPGMAGPYMVIDMEGVLVTSIDSSGAQASGRAVEQVSLNFAKVKVSYSRDGQRPNSLFGWDIAQNVAWR